MTRFIGALAVVFGLGSAGLAGAQGPPAVDREWAAIADDLDRSVITGDVEGMTGARDAARRRLGEAPSSEPRARLRYLLAYANWRLLGADPAPEGDERDALADEAESMLRANLDVRDDDVETHALLGAVYGMKIGSSIWRGMTLGRRASRAFDEARAIDERNPRFLLLKGLDVYHRPARFGGGLERAERWLRSAVGFFTAHPPDAPWPSWGRLDAHAWLGRTLARLGDPETAREQYEQVLAIEPDYAWVRDFLLGAARPRAVLAHPPRVHRQRRRDRGGAPRPARPLSLGVEGSPGGAAGERGLRTPVPAHVGRSIPSSGLPSARPPRPETAGRSVMTSGIHSSRL